MLVHVDKNTLRHNPDGQNIS